MSRELTKRRASSGRIQKASQEGLLSGGNRSRSLGPLLGLDQRDLPTGFERWRSELDMLSGMDLLDALTEPSNAAACIQTLPVVDLHHYLFAVGLEDAESVLALVSSEQVRQLLDIEVWDRSELLPARVDAWMFALQRAGADVLYQRVLDLDDALLNWVIKRDVLAYVIDDPESFYPPDEDHILTPDRQLCIVFQRDNDHLEEERAHSKTLQEEGTTLMQGGAGSAPIRQFVNMLMENQPELCIHLALAATAALPTQLEEDAYQWRKARMSDLGFIDYYEAREIYTPPPADWRRALPPQRIEDDRPPAKHWLALIIAPHQRLDLAFAALSWEDALIVAELLGYVANMTLSADRVALWDRVQQERTLLRLQAGLGIALELINGQDATPEMDAKVLAQHHLNYLFRLGYEQMVKAAEPVWEIQAKLKRGDDIAGALDDLPRLKSWAEALLGEHPEGRGDAGESIQLRTLEDCRVAREGALLIADLLEVAQPLYAELLQRVADGLAKGEQGLGAVSVGALLFAAYTRDVILEETSRVIAPLRPEEAAELHTHCFSQEAPVLVAPPEIDLVEDLPPPLRPLRPEAAQAISTWWAQRGGKTTTAPLALLRELREQAGAVSAVDLDMNFVPLLWRSTSRDIELFE